MIHALALLALAASQPAPDTHLAFSAIVDAPASPRVLRTLGTIFNALPETKASGAGGDGSGLSPSTLAWLDQLPEDRQVTVALLSIMSDQMSDGMRGHRRGNAALGALFLAAQLAAGGASSGSQSEHVLDTGGPEERSYASGSQQGKAARAIAWGKRLGIPEADFVDALRSLPRLNEHTSGPDFGIMLRDLGAVTAAR